MIVTDITYKQLYSFLQKLDDSFEPRLSNRVDLEVYATKLLSNAKAYCFKDSEDEIIGCLLVYCNNTATKTAYAPIAGVLKEYRGKGLIKQLFANAEEDLRNSNFEYISLETWLGGIALNYYIKNGYYVESTDVDRPDGGVSVKLKKDLKLRNNHFEYGATPLEKSARMSSSLNVNVFYKRDDLFEISGGGNKGRKLSYILKKAVQQECNAIVTAGGNQSNHVRSTALLAAKLSMKSSMVIHDTQPEAYSANSKLTFLSGAKMTFVEMKDVKTTMDNEVTKFIKEGFRPFYIWGGGHCVEGTFAYYKAVFELKDQLKGQKPDFIVLASGTGATQAGIEVGIKEVFPECKVLGVSIARDQVKGSNAVVESANELITSLEGDLDFIESVFFDDRFVGDGYEAIYPGLLDMIKKIAKEEGILLDPTYSGKAFYALLKYIESGLIPKGSNVVFWHTGGLMNLLASDNI